MNSKGRILKKVGLKFESIFKVLLSVYAEFYIFRVEAGRERHTRWINSAFNQITQA